MVMKAFCSDSQCRLYNADMRTFERSGNVAVLSSLLDSLAASLDGPASLPCPK